MLVEKFSASGSASELTLPRCSEVYGSSLRPTQDVAKSSVRLAVEFLWWPGVGWSGETGIGRKGSVMGDSPSRKVHQSQSEPLTLVARLLVASGTVVDSRHYHPLDFSAIPALSSSPQAPRVSPRLATGTSLRHGMCNMWSRFRDGAGGPACRVWSSGGRAGIRRPGPQDIMSVGASRSASIGRMVSRERQRTHSLDWDWKRGKSFNSLSDDDEDVPSGIPATIRQQATTPGNQPQPVRRPLLEHARRIACTQA
ncbi:hypothetical protein K438DRAFT_1769371 [Mycena galopus ATCC 62051]|nr:hypothetical protein K438DRAFT_1769371 [Mycena galopus ATCC 62051]